MAKKVIKKTKSVPLTPAMMKAIKMSPKGQMPMALNKMMMK